MTQSQDEANATRGFIAALSPPTIHGSRGNTVWDLTEYAFLEPEEAPTTVHPSLWRQARLNMHHGLFQIHDSAEQAAGSFV